MSDLARLGAAEAEGLKQLTQKNHARDFDNWTEHASQTHHSPLLPHIGVQPKQPRVIQ